MFPFVKRVSTKPEPEERKAIQAFTERLTNPSRDFIIKFIKDEDFAKKMVKLDSERMMKYYEIQDIIRLNGRHLEGKPLEQIQKLIKERDELLDEMIEYDKKGSSTKEAEELIELQYRNIQQEEGFYIDRFLRNYNTEVKLPIQFGEDIIYNNAVKQLRFEDAKEYADRKNDFNLKSEYLPKLEMFAKEVPAYKNAIMSEYLQWRQAKEAAKLEMYENSMKGKSKLSTEETQALIRSKWIHLLTGDIEYRKKESYDWVAKAELDKLKEIEDKIKKNEPNVDRYTLLEQRRELKKQIEKMTSKAKAEDINELEQLLQKILKSEPKTKTQEERDKAQDAATAARRAEWEKEQYLKNGGAEEEAAAAAAAAKIEDKAIRKARQTALDNERMAEEAAAKAEAERQRAYKEANTPITQGYFGDDKKTGKPIIKQIAPSAPPAPPAAPPAQKLNLTKLYAGGGGGAQVPVKDALKRFANQ